MVNGVVSFIRPPRSLLLLSSYFYSLGSKKVTNLGTETINYHFKNLGWKDKQSAYQWRSIITASALEKSNFGYEIIDRQLGRMSHIMKLMDIMIVQLS